MRTPSPASLLPFGVRALAACAALAMFWPAAAAAYIDPGSGSFMFQVVLGFVLTVSVTFRSALRRVLSSLKALAAKFFAR